jgi:RNA-binding protein
MTVIALSPAQRRDLRAQAHHLNPVVLMGNDGLTPAVMREIDGALKAHGLIKVRCTGEDRTQRDAMAQQVCLELSAGMVQLIGKLMVLWRPKPDADVAPKEDRGAGPKLVKLVKFSKSGNHRPQVKTIKLLGNQRVAAGGTVKRARPRKTASIKKTAA